ncbi:hypothetical protein KMZ29_16300 [Bradyrhizobium sediminis]|uniref:Uncharacterized protein n=1 Tax=Bradyrhizobium sediminis TaxID=2840469 RepID=A0A975RKB4_9BRAD|nr:hypothetical protein [Bradyrhizobium sediminis]QWG11307.1 hypothetical protein KMZ29_16300 [Bradyrhizobium sediminis]
MKLKVRIRLSPVGPAGAARRFGGPPDNHPLFPDVCAKSGKWFRRQENCFVGGCRTKQLPENFNDFSRPNGRLVRWASRIVHWPTPAISSGAGVNIGEPHRKTRRFEALSDSLTFLWWRRPLGNATTLNRSPVGADSPE